MDNNILTRPNCLDSLKNLRMVLNREILAHVIIEPLHQSLVVDALESVQRAYKKHLVDIARGGRGDLLSTPPCHLSFRSNKRLWMYIP